MKPEHPTAQDISYLAQRQLGAPASEGGLFVTSKMKRIKTNSPETA